MLVCIIISVSRGGHVVRRDMYFRESEAMFYCDAVSFGIYECSVTPCSLELDIFVYHVVVTPCRLVFVNVVCHEIAMLFVVTPHMLVL
jgi:hypothetical protein